MTQAELNSFYLNHIKDKDADELAAEIYALTGTSITGGYAKAMNDAAHGKDVRDDIVKLMMLQRAYSDLVIDNAGNVPANTAIRLGEIEHSLAEYNTRPLSDSFYTKENKDYNGLTFVWQDDGSCVVNGTATGNTVCTLFSGADADLFPPGMEAGGIYRLVYRTTDENVRFSLILTRFSNPYYVYYTEDSIVNIPSDCTGITIRLFVSQGVTLTNAKVSSMDILSYYTPSIRFDRVEDALKQYNSYPLNKLFYSPVNLESNGITYEWATDGFECTANGTCNTINGSACNLFYGGGSTHRFPPGMEADKYYKVVYETNDTNLQLSFVFYRPGDDLAVYLTGSRELLHVPADCDGITIRLYTVSGATLNTATASVMDIFPITAPIAKIDAIEAGLVDINRAIDANLDDAVEFYSDFEQNDGWWWLDGSILTNVTGKRTQLFPIRGGHDYYMGFDWETSCLGAFFDKYKNWIAPLRGSMSDNSDITLIAPSYTGGANTYLPDQSALDEPDISAYPASVYMSLRKFTAPENAAYFSLNALTISNDNYYRLYISSKLIFMPNGSGNFIISKNDLAYQKFKNKKLCIIGPSTVMVNRLWRKNANGDMVNPTETYGYISGFQEYLRPFFNEVKCFGYSGAAYMYGRGSATGKCSIYTRICGGTESFTYNDETRSYTVTAPDLSEYDVFMIYPDGNGLTSDYVGEYTDNVNTTYCGAIQLICNKILEQNPKAEIYLCTFQAAQGDSAYAARVATNEPIRMMATNRSFGLIDFAKDSIFNAENRSYYIYDAGGHRNNEGNKKNGLFVRKALLGF